MSFAYYSAVSFHDSVEIIRRTVILAKCLERMLQGYVVLYEAMLVADFVHSLLEYCNVVSAELPSCDMTSNDRCIVFDRYFLRYQPVVTSA